MIAAFDIVLHGSKNSDWRKILAHKLCDDSNDDPLQMYGFVLGQNRNIAVEPISSTRRPTSAAIRAPMVISRMNSGEQSSLPAGKPRWCRRCSSGMKRTATTNSRTCELDLGMAMGFSRSLLKVIGSPHAGEETIRGSRMSKAGVGKPASRSFGAIVTLPIP